MNGSSLYTPAAYSCAVLFSFSMRSHLFSSITDALPASCARPATLLSCSDIPSSASTTIRHTSARSTANLARKTEKCSILSSILLCLRIPAVSINTYLPYSFSVKVSTASRVVPATSETIRRSSPKIRLITELFPALGLPITATLIASFQPSESASSLSGGKYESARSSRSPVPLPCTDETGTGSSGYPSS